MTLIFPCHDLSSSHVLDSARLEDKSWHEEKTANAIRGFGLPACFRPA